MGMLQVVGQKNYAIHFAPTPAQSKDDYLENLKQLDEDKLGEHARYVTRMLPGGLWVTGIFFVCNEELFTSSSINIIRKAVIAVNKHISSGFCLHGKNPSSSLVVFHYNGSSKK